MLAGPILAVIQQSITVGARWNVPIVVGGAELLMAVGLPAFLAFTRFRYAALGMLVAFGSALLAVVIGGAVGTTACFVLLAANAPGGLPLTGSLIIGAVGALIPVVLMLRAIHKSL